jgi:SnoaL-like domain
MDGSEIFLSLASQPDGASVQSLIARYFRMWNDGDPASLDDVVAPGWIDHAHPERTTMADIRDAISRTRIETPGLQVYVDAILRDGNLITVNGRVMTDEQVENRVWIIRVEDDLMQEMWTYSAN